MLKEPHLYVANVGDSEVVLSRSGKAQLMRFERMTETEREKKERKKQKQTERERNRKRERKKSQLKVNSFFKILC